MNATLETARKELFENLAEKALTFGTYKVGKGAAARKVEAASNSDYGNRASLEISNAVVEAIVGKKVAKKLAGQTLGDIFEKSVAQFLKSSFLHLNHLRPGKWSIDHITTRSESAVIACEQYAHLEDLTRYCLEHRELAASLGNDYAIRNRKGRTPHIVIVTAECLPSRLASLALGTGDIDCLYHIALPELIESLDKLDFSDAKDMLDTMICGKRIRDITDLPLDLAV